MQIVSYGNVLRKLSLLFYENLIVYSKGAVTSLSNKKMAILAILTALALGIHVLEAQIPLPVQVQGVKLGLANIVTLFALFAMGWRDAAMILTGRVLLGAVFAGFGTLFYSMGGGLLAFLVAVAVKKILPEKQIWIAGILAALAHSVGQLLVAALIGGTPYILFYMPVMLVCSLFTGLFTGLCAQILVLRGKKLWKIILT
jgi:heptaprenyl diphosphate synthase